jgi:hypothetical protein
MKVTCHARNGFRSWLPVIKLWIPAEPGSVEMTEEQFELLKRNSKVAIIEGKASEPPPPPPLPLTAREDETPMPPTKRRRRKLKD